MDNIDLNVSPYNSGSGWTPIGTSGNRFYGHFDGNYKTISNLYINNSGGSYQGLFGYIASSGEAKNTLLSNVNVTASSYDGALAGQNDGSIVNVGVTGGTVTGGMRTGGLVGSDAGSMTRTFANVAVTFLMNQSPTCCVGGLVGEVAFGGSSATINNSYSRSSVTINYSVSNQGSVGGLLGNDYNSGTKSNLYSTGLLSMVSGSFPSNTGGLSGGIYTSISSSYWDTQTSGRSTSNGGIGVVGLVTSLMKLQASYTGWDFAGTWSIDSEVNDGYPYLQWESLTQTNSSPNTPSSLGGSSYVDGSFGNDNTPTLSFTLSDPNGSDTVKFQIQIDDSSDFSSPVVDYTSALAAQGSTNFTVGQAAGSGSYSIGSNGQLLSDGNFYWRVKAIDNSNTQSSYTPANSGSIAFKVDTAVPNTPGTPAAYTGNTDNTPSWSWTASSDSGSGLAATAYTVQWSQSTTFSSGVSASTSSSNSFTNSSPLPDGTWYFRALATDAVGNNSSFSSNGSLQIDTTAPTIPGKPAVTTASNNNKPALSWMASTDAIFGLGSPAYTVEWSNNLSFIGASSDTTTSNVYSFASSLPDSIWYFRVKAHDGAGNTSDYSDVGTFNLDTSVPKVSVNSTASTTNTIKRSLADLLNEASPAMPTAAIITLNSFEKFFNGGISLPLSKDQVIFFCVKTISEDCGETDRHTVTVQHINPQDGTVIIVIRSNPITASLTLNDEQEFDVNEDGSNDVAVKLVGFDVNGAQVIFRKLAKANPNADTQTVAASQKSNNWTTRLVLLLMVLAGIVLISKKRAGKID